MTCKAERFRVSSTVVVLAALVAGLLASGTAAARGTCVSATIDEPFVLPDGVEYAAGRLSLCAQGTHSPVATLHELRVDGIPVGLQISRSGRSEAPSDEPCMVFTRGLDGRLLLDGYSENGSIYAMRLPLARVRTFMGSASQMTQANRETSAPVIVAAMLD
jgi:hypothetical protein